MIEIEHFVEPPLVAFQRAAIERTKNLAAGTASFHDAGTAQSLEAPYMPGYDFLRIRALRARTQVREVQIWGSLQT